MSSGYPTGYEKLGKKQSKCDTAVPGHCPCLLCHLSLPALSPPHLLATRLCKRMKCQGAGRLMEGKEEGRREIGEWGCTHSKV